jgi:hypothetical protein
VHRFEDFRGQVEDLDDVLNNQQLVQDPPTGKLYEAPYSPTPSTDPAVRSDDRGARASRWAQLLVHHTAALVGHRLAAMPRSQAAGSPLAGHRIRTVPKRPERWPLPHQPPPPGWTASGRRSRSPDPRGPGRERQRSQDPCGHR